MGHSAGAHIAALLHYDERYLRNAGTHKRPCGLIGLSGPYDFLPLLGDELNAIFPANTHHQSQPVHFVDGSEGPALLVHGLKDNTVKPRNSASLAQLVEQAGGSASLKIYDNDTHTDPLLGLSRGLGFVAPVVADVDAFINQQNCPAQ